MTGKYTQSNRHARISTPLGEDVLLFKSLTGTERLGRPFQYELVLLSEEREINYKQIIGENVTVAVDKKGSEPRYFNGYISRFEQTRFDGPLREYRATMVPWLWFLTRSSDCKIFQEMTVPEILQRVFEDHGFSDVLNRLHEQYPKWEYCVQYRETAFNFVSRLMEQEGIYYYFKHENGKHSIVLCESIGSHLTFEGYEELPYRPRAAGATDEDRIWNWTVHREIQSGSYSINDFDFESPRKSLLGNHFVDREYLGSAGELYDYPGEFKDAADSDRYARLRLEELQARHEVFRGEGDSRGACAGVRFTLTGHPGADFEKEYLTTGVDYKIVCDDFTTEGKDSDKLIYEATLWAIDGTCPFRSPSATPKPEIKGPQTAMVVGPKGEEIYTDKYGRVKLQFHWDRYSKSDENSSCWVRVAQAWAGKTWGAMYIPRIGQEVVVEFLEGDPDRPIITGRVYNGDAMPPYGLPENKTRSTLKSNSSKDGTGFNELRFEDKKGEEQIFLHAEKDQEIRIKNDLKEWVGNEAHQIIKKDQFETVEGKKNTLVKGDRLIKTEGDYNETVKGDRLLQVEGGEHFTVKGDECVKIAGDASFKTDKNLNQEAAMKISVKSGQDFHGKAGTSFALDAGTTVHIKGGATVVIEGGAQVSLKAGPSFVDIGPSGVSISGPMVKINSGGAAASGSGSSPTAPAVPEVPDPPVLAKEAVKADPGQKTEPPPAPAPPEPATFSASAVAPSPAAQVLKSAAADGTPFCEECARAAEEQAARTTTWIEVELVGDDNKPVTGERYRVTLPDGTVEEGTLDGNGLARIEQFEAGECKISFPDLDQEAWEEV